MPACLGRTPEKEILAGKAGATEFEKIFKEFP